MVRKKRKKRKGKEKRKKKNKQFVCFLGVNIGMHFSFLEGFIEQYRRV